MRLLKITTLLLALAALALSGCSQQTGPMAPAAPAPSGPQFGYALPDGAILTSAVLFVYAPDADPNQMVDVHRLTRDWDEATVTWNNYNLNDGGAYDPALLASFPVPTGGAYASVDVTGQVLDWMAGADENLGFLLKREAFLQRVEMFSKERGENPPYLELSYLIGGDTVTEELAPLMDAQINEQLPDDALGLNDKLYAGWRTELEKGALIRFDLDVLPPDEPGGEGCTRTIGYWKTHAGFGPQDDAVTPLLGDGIWLGDAGGTASLAVTDRFIARDVLRMRTYGRSRNGITKLYAQLLAAKLNIANDADGADVADVIAAADAFLAEHDWQDWRQLPRATKAEVRGWKNMLDDYNNGLIGPGHCEDSGGCGSGGHDHGGHGHGGHGGGH